MREDAEKERLPYTHIETSTKRRALKKLPDVTQG